MREDLEIFAVHWINPDGTFSWEMFRIEAIARDFYNAVAAEEDIAHCILSRRKFVDEDPPKWKFKTLAGVCD